MDKDLEHLKLLGIFHYIWGALACLAGLIGVVYLIIGVALMMSPGDWWRWGTKVWGCVISNLERQRGGRDHFD
jgi:hypothetical protein